MDRWKEELTEMEGRVKRGREEAGMEDEADFSLRRHL